MADQAIAKYLSDNIGGVLSKALGEMAIAQPNDGVDFLARWFKVYTEQEEAKSKRASEEEELLEMRKKAAARLEERAAKTAAREKATAAKESAYKNALDKFSNPETDFVPEFWSDLLSVASTLTGAKAAYLGLYDEDGLEGMPGPLIRYTEVLPGSELMRDQVLPQGAGVTWGAVTENPGEDVPYLWRPPQPEPAEPNPDDPDAEPVVVPPPPYLPVSIPRVTDVPEVHYFEMTRLGAYFAVPLVYTSYLSVEALAEAKTYEKEKKATEDIRRQKQEEYDAAVEEALHSGGEEAAAAVEKPPELVSTEEKPLELQGKTVKMVLCLDTLGTNTEIDPSKFEPAFELCKALAKCKETTEKRHVDHQALADIDEEARHKVNEAIAEARHKVAEATQEEEQTEAEPEEDARKELVHKRWACTRAARVLNEMKDIFFSLKSWVVAPPEMLSIIAAAGYMFGMKKADLYPKGKPNLEWPTLCALLNDSWIEMIQQADVALVRKNLEPEEKLAAIKAMLPAEYDHEKVKELSPALELLWAVLDAAIDYRTAYLNNQKALYDKQVADNAEAEEPVTLPPLEELDDDLAGLA